MQLPEVFLNSLDDVPGFDREAFESVHKKGEQLTSIRLNPAKGWTGTPQAFTGPLEGSVQDTMLPAGLRLPIETRVPWSQFGYYLLHRPSFTFDPLFHAGCYYVQEASSMFLEQALRQLADLSQPLRVLDLSAAPGGKSTHLQSLISPESLLVSNEVIKSRCAVLTDNIIKWGSCNVVTTNNDPAAFKQLEGFFDVVVVDAPCSGSGLFRKDPDAIHEWSPGNVILCSQRQQRILADVLPALKENGLLIYSTCSYSREEDEDISDWLVEDFQMKNEKLKIQKEWGIVESISSKTNSAGYRFYPDKVKGEGFFISCFRKMAAQREAKLRPAKLEKATAKEKTVIQSWIKNAAVELIKENNFFVALPTPFMNDYAVLKQVLNVQYKGTGVGQIMKDKLVPDHSLALSSLVSENVAATELPYDEAIKYLQRQELHFTPAVSGWQIVRYQKYNLGWINALPNRINNYYPKEMRILKLKNDSGFEK